MEIFITVITLLILAETTFMLLRGGTEKVLRPQGSQRRKIYIDTSSLMDGRILNVAQTGFLGDDLIIPRSVVRELQMLADGKDREKRSRARFGLDTAHALEQIEYCSVSVLQDALDHTAVDERLIQLAKANNGLICTTDFNLNKVAATEGVRVLNINDLSLVLRAEYLPGERFRVRITAAGSNPNQGVGHMPDGTMVIIDHGGTKVDQDVEIEVIRFLQTSAGRMVFARISSKNRKRKGGGGGGQAQPAPVSTE